VFSFHEPATSHVGRLCAGPAERLAASDWADSEDRDEQRHFVHLLNGALDEQLRPAARSAKNPHLLFVRAPRDVTAVQLPGLGGQTRTVVKPYLREDGSLKYVRHLAMDRRFKRFGGTWYLEILPSYFFSYDGWWESKFAAQYLSGIKRSERHADMRRHVQTWTWILRGEVDLGGLTPDPQHQLLEFGAGLAVEMDTADGDLAGAEDDDEHGEEWNAA